MQTIYKYPMKLEDEQLIDMPRGAEVLTVQVQRDAVWLWAKVDPDEPLIPRRILTHGTGHEVTEAAGRYIDTFQLHGGDLVFHVFEGIS
jgi:hypothetical protein